MTKKIISFIAKEIIVAIVLLLCALLFLNISTLISMKKIENGGSVETGYANAIVKSGSMEPSLSKYDLIIIKAKSEYHEGDIVTFVSQNGTLVTHRVMAIAESGIITQGDANNTLDDEIEEQRLLGKVILIVPIIGLLATLLSAPVGIICIIGFPICILLIDRIVRTIKDEQERII